MLINQEKLRKVYELKIFKMTFEDYIFRAVHDSSNLNKGLDSALKIELMLIFLQFILIKKS